MVLLWRKELWMLMQLLIWKVKSNYNSYIPKKINPKGSFHINWSDTIDYDSPIGSYIGDHKGTLMFVSEEANDGDSKANKKDGIAIGAIKCTKINDQLSNDGLDRFEYLDTKSGGLSSVGQLMDAIDWFKEVHVSNYHRDYINGPSDRELLTNDVGAIDEIRQGSVLYISSVTINDDYKGLGLGLYLVDKADRILNDYMSLCLMIPFPLQYESRMDDDCLETPEFAVAKKKVTNNWMRY